MISQAHTQILRACVLEKSAALAAWENWKQTTLLDEIDPASYKLIALAARNLGIEDPKCKGVYRKTWAENHLLWSQVKPLLLFLIEKGVKKIVLLKGMAMILGHYHDFGVRVMGDVDILVPRSSLPLAISLLEERGWKRTFPFDPTREEHLKRWNGAGFLHEKSFRLDLHWRLLLESSPELDEESFTHAKPTDREGIYLLGPTELLLQTCVHGMKWSPVPLIRWVADAMTLLKKEAIDWERLEDLAKKSSVCRPLALAFRYLAQEFGASIPILERLQKSPSLRLENLELWLHLRGRPYFAGWIRSCLRERKRTLWSQLCHLPKYLQATALLKSLWHIPFYALYWIAKRLRSKLAFKILR